MVEYTHFHCKYYATELTRKSPKNSVESVAKVVSGTKLDLNPHQIDAALFAFRSPFSKGVILADEVGLGKTIEAGIVISQYWAEQKRKIIVICPSSLRKQWNQELLDKFRLQSVIMDRQAFDLYKSQGVLNPYESQDIIICSYHFARNTEEYIKKIKWDLAILDEAHKMRNIYRKNKIAVSIKNSLEGVKKILLTATPLQNSLLELFGLVSFIDDYVFGDLFSYKHQFSRMDKKDTENYDDLKVRLSKICQRTLRKQVIEYVRYTNRIPMTQEFTPLPDELRLYELVRDYLRRKDIYAFSSKNRHLMTLILLKLLSSSSFAVANTLKSLIKRLYGIISSGKIKLKDNSDIEIDEDFIDEWAEEMEDNETSTIDNELNAQQLVAAKEELAVLNQIYKLASSIEDNSKGNALVSALDKGFDKLNKIGAPQKALIFTEFRRTQDYLFRKLNETHFKGKIVLFNGSNNDELCNKIYLDWLRKNKDSDRVSGSTTADKRAAIIDYFKDEAHIMIATEAAAEGINLQFCAQVVNYDLPWNPQRIEQRIGRCHRYGQKFDVVALNFVNKGNIADQRIFELLSTKFKLFEGVFGASDEVLGAIESGIDFENRIAKIYQECRTSKEIQDSFDKLQKELETEIKERITNTKKKLLEHFDEEVHQKMKMNIDQSKIYLNYIEDLLWRIANTQLNKKATFNDAKMEFDLKTQPFGSKKVPLGRYSVAKSDTTHLLGLQSSLATVMLDNLSKTRLSSEKLLFDYSSYDVKITPVEKLRGKSGSLKLYKIKIIALEEEEYLFFAGFDEKGSSIPSETFEKMFRVPGRVLEGKTSLKGNFEVLLEKHNATLIEQLSLKNTKFFEEEMDKLDSWAEDQEKALKLSLKELDEEINMLKKEARLLSSLAEKLKKQKDIRALQEKRDKDWRNYENTVAEIRDRKDRVLDEIEAKLKQKVEVEEIFAIEWVVK